MCIIFIYLFLTHKWLVSRFLFVFLTPVIPVPQQIEQLVYQQKGANINLVPIHKHSYSICTCALTHSKHTSTEITVHDCICLTKPICICPPANMHDSCTVQYYGILTKVVYCMGMSSASHKGLCFSNISSLYVLGGVHFGSPNLFQSWTRSRPAASLHM